MIAMEETKNRVLGTETVINVIYQYSNKSDLCIISSHKCDVVVFDYMPQVFMTTVVFYLNFYVNQCIRHS